MDRVMEGLLRHGLAKRVYQASQRAKENTAPYLVLPAPMTEAKLQSIEKKNGDRLLWPGGCIKMAELSILWLN